MSDNQGIRKLFLELKKQRVRADNLIFDAEEVVIDGISITENHNTVTLQLELVLFYNVSED